MCDFFFSFQVRFFFFLGALWGFPVKKGEKEENLTGEERWEEEEKDRKFTEREREREIIKLGFFFFLNIVWIVWLGCWNNNKKRI